MYRTGQNHQKAKLSTEDVDLIRELREQYQLPYRIIGEKFEASMWTIRDICEYKTRVNA